MNFSVYLDDKMGKRLQALSEATGESRNALIRRAIEEFVSRKMSRTWPEDVMAFMGDPKIVPFEQRRSDVKAPADDPFEKDEAF